MLRPFTVRSMAVARAVLGNTGMTAVWHLNLEKTKSVLLMAAKQRINAHARLEVCPRLHASLPLHWRTSCEQSGMPKQPGTTYAENTSCGCTFLFRVLCLARSPSNWFASHCLPVSANDGPHWKCIWTDKIMRTAVLCRQRPTPSEVHLDRKKGARGRFPQVALQPDDPRRPRSAYRRDCGAAAACRQPVTLEVDTGGAVTRPTPLEVHLDRKK